MNRSPTRSGSKPSGRIKDARGRTVNILDPYELRLLRRFDVIPADVLEPVARELGFGLPTWQRRDYVASVLMFLACIVFLVLWKIARGTGVDAVERVLWPVNILVFAFAAMQFWRSGRRARARRAVTLMCEHRRCPHCGYDLRLLPREPNDGATQCPECGSAWLLGNDGGTGDPRSVVQ
jgi:hypothetical protein